MMRSNIADPEARRKGFTWSQARRELGFPEDRFNIGWYCADRICDLGMGEKTALIWEAVDGSVRRFTFNELRVYANAYAKFLTGLGLKPGDRVAVFSERVPELYIGLIGGLKAGLVMQPLFSAFGEDALEKRL
jgi:acetyl-CoA synthetase